jgi:hypothetical protein
MTMTNQHTDSVLIQQMEILKGDNTMTKTPDYNDGAIYWWSGPNAPEQLDPKTLVRANGVMNRVVSRINWSVIFAFQVIKQHVEPRVCWVNIYKGGTTSGLYENEQEALKWARSGAVSETIRVVEQPESET